MTLGGAAKARLRLIVWWKNCQHQLEPDPPNKPSSMALRRAFSTGDGGLCARDAEAERLIWS